MELRAHQIIDRLKEIQLERVRLIQEERRLTNLLERAVDIQQRPRQESVSIEHHLSLEGASTTSDISYSVGERVYIKNKLGALAPEGRRASLKDRTARIVALEDNRIYIRNYSNKESWRAAHNLRPVTQEESNRISTFNSV